MFLLKKIIAPLLYPLPFCLLILITGLYMLWFTSRQKAGKILVSAGVAILTILGYGIVSDILLGSLEYQYPSFDLRTAYHDFATSPPFIVVLAGGHVTDPNIPITSQISTPSLTRLIEGIRIHRKIPGSKLILSGKGAFDPVPEAETMAQIALLLGTARDQIILEVNSNDTAEQAVQLKKIIGEKKFILVTSALHMPRSVALFKKQGMKPIPAPTEHQIAESQKWSPGVVFPSAYGIVNAKRAVHEYMGLIWSKLTGDI